MLLLCVLGTTGGIPFVLTASTLVVWFKKNGEDLSLLGLLSLLHLPYALKFLWAPFFDSFSLNFFKEKSGHRRSWIIICQLLMIAGLFLLSEIPPNHSFALFMSVALWVSFWASSHDMLVAACQMDMVERKNWGLSEASTVFGFRLGMLISGAGALSLSLILPWGWVYKVMAIACVPGLLMILFLPFTLIQSEEVSLSLPQNWRAYFKKALLQPFQNFMSQDHWQTILLFMVIYRLQDSLIGILPTVFFLQLGFSKGDIATVYKVFGMGMAILGGFTGGIFVRVFDYQRALLMGLVCHGLSSFTYIILTFSGLSLPLFYGMVALEEFTRGVALTAFFAYQLTCCRLRFSVTQLAILTAVASLGQSLIGSTSGFLAQSLGWSSFFLLTALASLPALYMLKRIPFSPRVLTAVS